MSARRLTVEDWRNAVFCDPHVTDATKVLLLLLADYMSPDLKVSVARPTLARQLNRSERRIAERLREAIGESTTKTDAERRCRLEHRLLDRVARGQKHVQAVYQGLIPDALSRTHVCPAEGEAQQDAQEHPENAQNRPAETPGPGAQQDTRGSRLTRADLSVSGHHRNVGSDEEQAGPGAASRPTACEAHGWADCPDRECIDDAEARGAS